jgi:CheY-like chemotaxis protein
MSLNGRYVLMLEKDKDDRYFTESTLKELQLQIPIKYVSDNKEFFSALRQPYKPSIIILTYYAFPEDVLELVKKCKLNAELAFIPVVILSEDISRELVVECYRSGANSVIKKPSSVDLTRHKINTFFNYWLHVAEVN